jgi:hypothetical protein
LSCAKAGAASTTISALASATFRDACMSVLP